MLKFFRSPRFEDRTISGSPYVDKLEVWLKLAAVPYEEVERPVGELLEHSPLKMIPYVELDGRPMADTGIIIDRLRELHNDPLDDARLSHAQHMKGEMLRSICEVDFLYIMVYERWLDGDYKTWANFLASERPENERDAAAEEWLQFMTGVANTVRVGRYDKEHIRKDFRKKMEVFSHCLGDGPWLFGDKPSSYDAGFYGFMSSTIHYPIPENAHVKISREYTNLVEYCDRVRKLVYDFDPVE